MTDFARLDERGRAAGAGLRAAATFRPATIDTTPAPSRTPRGMVWAAALALVAVVAGVVYLTGRDTPPADTPDPTTGSLRYVLGDLPEGWSVTSAKDAGVSTAPDNDAGVQYVLYGTSGDPTAPTLLLLWSGDVLDYSVSDFQATGAEYRELLVAGQNAVCGKFGALAAVICAVPTSPDSGLGTVIVRAGGMTLDQIASTVEQLVVDPAPSLPVDQLPAGAVQLGAGVGTDSMFVAVGEPDPAGIVSVEYATATGEPVYLLTGDGATQQLAGAATITSWTRRDAGGVTYFVSAPNGEQRGVLWARDGLVFALSAPVSEDELIRLAASVRPATDDEWAALPPRLGEGTAVTSVPPTVDTQAPPTSVASSYEVEVGLTVEPLPGGRVQVSSTGEGTSSSTFTLRLTETEFAFTAGSFSAAGGLSPIGPLVNPINAEPGVWAIIPGGGTLVVHTVDGGQFTARTSQPVEGVDVDFALVAVPLEVIAAEAFDADGTLLETWTPEA
ncbi:MAG: hypothetical protein RL238_2198 [Actinomycetota bacterium]|jgi:hypothetical protein